MKTHFKNSIIFFAFLILLVSCNEKGFSPAELLTVSEGFTNPIGFYDADPTFSWKLPVSSNSKTQSAYHIVAASSPDLLPDKADLWDSEKQQSSQSIFVKYNGKELVSSQKVYWQVKYWNQEGKPSSWSAVNHFELGLLKNSDWQARWIGLPTAKDADTSDRGSIIHKPQYLRKDFEIPENIASARLYVTAKGVFDAWINGEDVSNDVMPPGWTPYQKRIETITYDVTHFVNSGKNTLAFELAPGWYAGRLGWSKEYWKTSSSPKILSQLEITLKDGSKKVIISDDSWKATNNGPIRFSEIYDGEIYNANYEIPKWNKPNYDDSAWQQVLVENIDTDVRLEPKRHHPVKQKLTLQPKTIIGQADASVIFDLGQNMVGVPLVKVPVKKGDTLKIRFSEMLSPDGSFYTQNYRSAKSTDYYIAKADETIQWSPKFTFHGFRYVELSGYDQSQKPTKDWITGLVQYSDFEQKGSFTSSQEKLNQLQSNIVWGLRGNFFDIPTDCPQRDERLGWTGDAQVFAPTSIYNADVHAFWASWLESMRDSQYENGGIPFVVPDVLKNNNVSSGWGDAAVVIPWEIYFRTGDESILEENFEMMKRWVQYHKDTSNDFISRMNSFADWLQPYPVKGGTKGDTSKELIGTAYFAHVSKLTAQAAKVLNKQKEASEFETLYQNVAHAFENEFFNDNGEIKDNQGTQTGYLLALGFDLLSNEKKQKAIPHLLEKIEEADNHLRTGFLGTPLLSKVLDDIGRIDLMYQLLFNETYPSWFYSINQGATTVWERWNSYSKTEGFSKEKMNSLNHYAYGAIGQWMYERIAGIAPLEAGYKKIRIAPRPHEPLTTASGALDTPYGKVSSSWKYIKGEFSLEITIPSNTTALLSVLYKDINDVTLNGVKINNDKNIKIVEQKDDEVVIEVSAGKYTINSKF
ncbi:family 78 glycoside hydrolase catalytic domain [Mariniflexile sp.]|uniref:family 78 glycoside hydrolase catalytic domain n=1 Tax=Mariniflexile sp. TaxID=1979402 RepID=UPI004048E407